MRQRILLFILVCASTPIIRAQTMKTVPGMYATIAAAVTAAAPGDTISIAAGTYSEQLRIQKDLTFIGAGQNLTIIREGAGIPDSTAFFVDHASVTLRNLQFFGGVGTNAGMRGLVALYSTTVIRHCAFVAFFNAFIADVNGTMDIDTVTLSSVDGGGPVVVDSAAAGQFANVGDLGVLLVNSHFSISHLTAGAFIDHIIDIHPDLHFNPTFLGQDYAVDVSIFSQGTIEQSTFFGSRDGYWGQGIRVNGSMTRQPADLVIRNNRFRGVVTDSTKAMPDMPTTAGISFNGYNGYADIYNNSITQFNSGIAFYGIASAKVHDNVIIGNGRYGIVTTSGIYGGTPPDIGGGGFGSSGGNTIAGNGHYNVYNQTTAALWACSNYWGTTDPAAIDALIYDDNENAGRGIVHFDNYLLPVELSSFTAARMTDHQIVLTWKTATEINNLGFEVERTVRGGAEAKQQWTPIGFVDGHGMSNAPHEYVFADANLPAGRYAYRLKQIDRDGRYEYSGSLDAEIGTVPNVFELLQNFPNPFNPTTTMSFSVPADGYVSLIVYNVLGERTASVFEGLVKTGSVHTVTFDASRLTSGVYFVRMEFNGRQLMKKITLMK